MVVLDTWGFMKMRCYFPKSTGIRLIGLWMEHRTTQAPDLRLEDELLVLEYFYITKTKQNSEAAAEERGGKKWTVGGLQIERKVCG